MTFKAKNKLRCGRPTARYAWSRSSQLRKAQKFKTG